MSLAVVKGRQDGCYNLIITTPSVYTAIVYIMADLN